MTLLRKLSATLAAGILAALALALPADAHTATCPMPSGFYVNADEKARLPHPAFGGLTFSGSDLIHHATTGTVADLTPGSFIAHPAPDQSSFFSVEVSGPDGKYGTLRWDTTVLKWTVVTQGSIYSNVSPAALVDMPPIHLSKMLVSFGVGYTATPPGTVTTIVSSIRFAGHVYDLRCHRPGPSHSPSASPSPSASVSTSASASAGPVGSGTHRGPSASVSSGAPVLAVTGPPVLGFALIGGSIALLGIAAYVLTRRRTNRFTS